MTINVNIVKLREMGVTPNEYITLHLINTNNKELDFWADAQLYDSLKSKGLIKNFKNKSNNLLWVIEEWLPLWPTEITPQGYRVSGNSITCLNKMENFCLHNPQYTKDIILEATANYLNRKASSKYNYTKKNHKFIYDKDTSDLKLECEIVLKKQTKTNSNIIDL